MRIDLYLHIMSAFTCLPLLVFVASFQISCGNQHKESASAITNNRIQEGVQIKSEPEAQLAQYIRNIYEDKNGHLWFGTNGYGVIQYNGDSLSYYSNHNGFDGQQITGITEDINKNIWFATDQGVVQYRWDSMATGEKKFINYSSPLLFYGQRFWSIMADSKGSIWAGAESGVYKFDGVYWLPVSIPYPDEAQGSFITTHTAWSIIEDSKANIWISTNGFGAYNYDGKVFSLYSEEIGLANNNVDVIMEDKAGALWFGTRFGGVSRLKGNDFEHFNVENNRIGNNEVCALYEDPMGHIWISSEGYGVYKFDGQTLTNYNKDHGLEIGAVQTILEDSNGRLWVGGGGGLYVRQNDSFVHVGQESILSY